jgi:hypothetical protein
METTNLTKLTRLLWFSGLREYFQARWIRFVAYASVGKFLAALKNGGESIMPSTETVAIDEATDAGKETAAAKEQNALAMANLTMAFKTEGLLGMI